MSTRKTAEARKAEIIDATLRLAARLGPDSLTTQAIADEVGLTQPGLFRHYPKKQDLWLAVATCIEDMMEKRWQKILDSDDPPLARVRAIILAQLGLIQSTPAIPAILFSRELHSQNRGLRTAFFRLMSAFHGHISDLMAAAGSLGELRPELDCDDAAYLLIGLVQGLAMRWSISDRSFGLCNEGERLLALQLEGLTRSGGTAGDEEDAL